MKALTDAKMQGVYKVRVLIEDHDLLEGIIPLQEEKLTPATKLLLHHQLEIDRLVVEGFSNSTEAGYRVT